MNKYYSFLLALLMISVIANAQEKATTESNPKIIRIVGKLINKQNQDPIPFANVGIIGSYIGAASNLDGVFEFKIPGKYRDKTIQASAVGFTTYTETVVNCILQDTLRIELSPVNYSIGEVEVMAESQVLQKILKTAVEKIPDNYIQTPFNYDVYYRSEKLVNNELSRLREAAVRIYDDKGYQREDAYQVFKERGYKFLQVRKNFEPASLADASTYLDELLEMDIVRGRGNILNANHIGFYDLKLERVSEYENDSIWVISYKSKKPMLSNTGDYYAKSYSGKIYIKTKDYAVIKNETHVEASNCSPQGRSFYVNPERQKWQPLKIEYDFSVTYKQYSGSYYLSYISYKRHHELKEKASGKCKNLDINTEMLITKINTQNPEIIEKRAYYENMAYNKNFWESYNIIFDEE
ncbi:carboxypeptidase-like regulatory domain-containing protein [Ancylomarina longa]|uniref:Carboxypeptidase-like regulatory domain-containing protein n=1 Tax=Ancylomarina longa TaxID=2487017 RepID=A0A434AXF1_9BACT|nr:carboxypeptidase-like regulatory domain-containing protein [Ancylomarina longa]RUT79215.1 carboxypeptidase-like regulatory domain-containing protein [Ancylomarina longa]